MTLKRTITLIHLTASVALFFAFLGLLKGARSWYYTGASGESLLWVLGGFVVAWALLSLAAFLAQGLWLRLRGALLPEAVVGLVAGAGLWGLMLCVREDGLALDDALPVVVLLGLGLHWAIWGRLGNGGAHGALLVWDLVFASGMAVAVGFAEVFALREDHGLALLVATGGWVVVVGVLASLVFARVRGGVPKAVFAVVLLGASIGYAFCARPVQQQSSALERRPNVLLITLDALRADTCSIHGGPVPTPNLARLCAGGVQFTQARVVAPWTLPSVFSMFASSYCLPSEDEGFYQFPAGAVTLSETLSARGYRTAALVGNWLLGNRAATLRGFERQRVVNNYDEVRAPALRLTPFLRDALLRVFPSRFAARPLDTSGMLTYHALAFLRGNANRPFYLWVHFMDPHDPYDPPERYRDSAGPWPFFTARGWGEKVKGATSDYALSADEKAYIRQLHEEEVRYVDECLGRLLDEVERLSLGEETFVVALSDHGEEFWDHGGYYHGQSLHEELLRVPFVAAGPGLEAGRVVEEAVSALDVMPSLAGWVGVEADSSWQGESLDALLDSQPGGSSQSPHFFYGVADYLEPIHEYAVLEGDLKLIRCRAEPYYRLYDLKHDPGEAVDVASRKPHRAEALQEKLDTWVAGFTKEPPILSEDERREMEARLERLGYLGG